MKYLLPIVLTATTAPALAQHHHKASAHAEPTDAAAQKRAQDPHAGHDMRQRPLSQPTDKHAGHTPTNGAPSAHQGHEPGVPDPPIAGPSATAFSGPIHAADAIFGAQAMAPARDTVRREHGAITSGTILIDQFEAVIGKGQNGYAWNAQAWYGGDIDRLWLKTEGEGRFGESPETAEIQALWSRAINPWFNLQAGVRHDFRPVPHRTYATLGLQGLAPYWFEVDSALFLSNKGDLTARLELEYDQRLTQKLIVQPEVELNLAAQNVPELGIGSGLSTAELGLRLRYHFVPEFAPYVGVKYERAFGDTADFRRVQGDKTSGWNFLIGIRSWL